jgi:hypothetical protein
MVLLLGVPPAASSSASERLAQRGPPTLAVGTLFTVSSPFAMLAGAFRGGRVAVHACRFGHGLKMIVAGAVLLPAGLLAAPFHPEGLPGGWMDGVVDAFQEDYCTRPLTSVYP